ncbi:MAG: hypothetical protein E6Y12_03015 [Dermabacter sp.]|nr:hypothetical protein [Dermabacter sp.]
MSEIVKHEPAALETQMRFAEMICSPKGQSILPKAYQGNPANALVAINLGSAMGLAPAESLYRIDVIGGTPSASAELVASNVRKAGHKLRVHVDEANMSVTAQIIRADDPDYTYEVKRDMKWAQEMGLAGKDNYKKQPLTMLQWRAITAVARLAASEALYGVGYTADELQEVQTPARPRASAADFTNEPAEDAAVAAPSDAQVKRMWAGLRSRIDETQHRNFMEDVVGHPIESSKTLTADEVAKIIDAVEGM